MSTGFLNVLQRVYNANQEYIHQYVPRNTRDPADVLVNQLLQPQANYRTIFSEFAATMLTRTVYDYVQYMNEEQENRPEMLTPIRYGDMDDELKKYYKECTICVDDFINDSQITITDCNHCYHHQCISEWIKHKSNCPICRKDF